LFHLPNPDHTVAGRSMSHGYIQDDGMVLRDDGTDLRSERAILVHKHCIHRQRSITFGHIFTWSNVFIRFGLERSLARMSSYVRNLGVISTLLGGVAVSLLPAGVHITKVNAMDTPAMLVMLGCSGALSFVLFFVAVLSGIAIDNSILQIPTEEAFLELLSEHHAWLAIPTCSRPPLLKSV